MDTFHRLEPLLSVHCVMTVPVQSHPASLLVLRGVTLLVMLLEQIAWHEVQATGGTCAFLPLDQLA